MLSIFTFLFSVKKLSRATHLSPDAAYLQTTPSLYADALEAIYRALH
ncbi:hypothetical protein [Photobacterium sp. 1_MG-2023]|nr:hypothetical protein [Photobacterium sp. 1_MG-2023]